MQLIQIIKKYFVSVLLLAALAIAFFKPSTGNLNTISRKIEVELNSVEQKFITAIESDSLLNHIATGNLNSTLIADFTANKIALFYYDNDSLSCWTTNSILLTDSPSKITSTVSVIRLKNGWYQCLKWSDTVTHEIIIGLMPVKYEYPFENKFLKSDFALYTKVPHTIELSQTIIAGSIPIKSLKGDNLFSLYVSGNQVGEDINYLLLIAQVIVLLIIFYYLHLFSLFLLKTRNFFEAYLVLIAAIFIVRGIMLWFNLPSEFNKFSLFDPTYYASSLVTKSLGDLILNSILLIWITWFYTSFRKISASLKYAFAFKFINLEIIFLLTALVIWVFKTLVMDSLISFEVYNILSLDLYSVLGLLCISILLVTHFIYSRNVILSLQQTHSKSSYFLIFSTAIALVFSSFAMHSQFSEIILVSAIWTVGYILLLNYLLRKDVSLGIKNLLIYISLYALLSTYLIESLYENKERNQRQYFSDKLVTERDFVTEYIYADVIVERIKKDDYIQNFFTNPAINHKLVSDRLSAPYLVGYFNKYGIQLFSFDATGKSLKNEDTSSIAEVTRLFKIDSIKPEALQYVVDTSLNYSYVSSVSFKRDSTLLGTFIIRLMPKIYYGQNLYPELLISSNVTVSNNVNNYAYAIYKNDKLIAQYGDFPYTYQWNKEYKFGDENVAFIEEQAWEHNIQKFETGKKVIVSIAREPVFEPLATFSYLFTFFFIIVISLLFFIRITSADKSQQIVGNFSLSFRTRINYSMLLMILISFLIIGFITISFFSKQYDSFYTDRLVRKEKVVLASLEYFIQQKTVNQNLFDRTMSSELEMEVARLSDINSIDINLFNKVGDLAVSSQQAIYDKGLLSRKMNPAALFDFENNKSALITKQENIGSLNYLATYSAIRNTSGEAIAYLGIPYFERSKNINDEVSSFLVALMNVYVFLLICAAVLAYFVSNSITRPLTIISEKLRILNLNKKNEPIEWNSQDEIGTLVSEYNKMITELEQSAQKLAKGERETAWREMAKQIAHEIKNPLTPMKLSIQYLQRAIDEGHPNIEQLAKKVSKTLEEQIENLSSIATAFSSFAKMPKAENEIINLNELIKSIADLFNREERSTVSFTSLVNSPLVFADKNQLISVFNNLVKNAIQSIPESKVGFVETTIVEEDGWIIVSVKDNGSGISTDNYENVFVPNFTTKSSGTGLGLAITKQIIDGAGGTIWFVSQEGSGTIFNVKLRKSQSM